MVLGSAPRARLQATLACLVALLLWLLLRRGILLGAVVVTGALALVAWTAPGLYRPIQHALDRVTRALLWGVSWTLLGLVYFGFFTPLRGLRWLFRRADAVASRPSPTADSYLVPLRPTSTGQFDRQF